MLKHMGEAESIDGIVGGMDKMVRVGEIGLDDESGWITGLGGGGVIGTGVAATGEDVGDITILIIMVVIVILSSTLMSSSEKV